ncbi:hypothetical protein ACMGGS_18965 [Superficieibacter sp. BNK-5]|uniref:hypothetical protein n=1 Tax=Superficieibacter sp. BNK-5 TaxID=3376142 RepID=UPI0039BFF966
MKMMTMGITRNCGVIRSRSPSKTGGVPPKSGNQIYIGANFLVCWLIETSVGSHFISVFFTRLFSPGAMAFSTHLFFLSGYFDSQQDDDNKRFLSLRRASRGKLSVSASRWQKVTGKCQLKVDILLQLFHHNICSGESLMHVPFRAVMMLSAGEKILNNKSVVVCNV